MHVIWPFLWIWAYLYKPGEGWGMEKVAIEESPETKEEIEALKNKIETLEARLQALEGKKESNAQEEAK
jgi:hypothetical protein